MSQAETRPRITERFLTLWSRPVARLPEGKTRDTPKRQECFPSRRILPYV